MNKYNFGLPTPSTGKPLLGPIESPKEAHLSESSSTTLITNPTKLNCFSQEDALRIRGFSPDPLYKDLGDPQIVFVHCISCDIIYYLYLI